MKDQWDLFYKRHNKDISPQLPKLVRILKKEKRSRVLDFCCGTGRHTIYMAKMGFDVYGFDKSRFGLGTTRKRLKAEKLSARLRMHDMLKPLPYKDNYFDCVVAVRATYHTTYANIKKIFNEIYRITKPGGYFYLHGHTEEVMRGLRAEGSTYKPIEHGTYLTVNDVMRPEQKGIKYHVFNKKEILGLMSKRYDVLRLDYKRGRGAFYLIAKKKGSLT
jgi:ubiquinone/menaquinone biosynthesis C-methylase UbiE